jgi:hypothetical protein
MECLQRLANIGIAESGKAACSVWSHGDVETQNLDEQHFRKTVDESRGPQLIRARFLRDEFDDGRQSTMLLRLLTMQDERLW